MDSSNNRESSSQAPESNGGLYKGAKVTVKMLNIVIIAGILLVAVLIFAGPGKGYAVTYDSQGGSDVKYQTYQYQEPLDFPEPPAREGYTFQGWAIDRDGNTMVKEGSQVLEDVTLYAIWAENGSGA